MARDRNALLRNLIAGYGDAIRLSDIKANIAVLFVAIMMGTVLGFRDSYPSYLSVPVLLAPFIVIFSVCSGPSIRDFPAKDESASRSGARRNRKISSSSMIRRPKLRACRLDARSCRGFSTGRMSPFKPPISFRWRRSSLRRSCCSRLGNRGLPDFFGRANLADDANICRRDGLARPHLREGRRSAPGRSVELPQVRGDVPCMTRVPLDG